MSPRKSLWPERRWNCGPPAHYTGLSGRFSASASCISAGPNAWRARAASCSHPTNPSKPWTGWSAYDSVDGVDVDWLPLQFIARDDDQEFSQFSQEFRITSPGGEFFDYVAGVYYEQSDLEFDRAGLRVRRLTAGPELRSSPGVEGCREPWDAEPV